MPARRQNDKWLAVSVAAGLLLTASSAGAQPVQGASEGNAPAAVESPASETHLLGDMGGLRSMLAGYGLSLGLTEQSEVLGNVTGGLRRMAAYEGVTLMGLGMDTEKAFGLPGGIFNITAFQFHGRGLTANAVPAITALSSAEQTVRNLKLFELWYEQSLFDKTIAFRVGQIAADQEFLASQYAGLFINSGYGFPTLTAVDLPASGPAYPLATPGMRLRYTPNESVTILTGVFNGNPAGPGTNDPQRRDGSGTAFRLHDGTFAISELQYGLNQADDATGLPGTYKIGFWYDSLPFADQRLSYTGQSLADPANTAPARTFRNNYSFYAVMDQLVWKQPDTKDGGVGVFARAMGAPPDRNLVDIVLQAGATYKAPFAGRENDTVGFAVTWAHISRGAAKLATDTRFFTGQNIPNRHSETQLELTYQIQLAAWLQVQPDFQYVINPGGGLPNPTTGGRVGDAAVLGVRSVITF